MAKKTFTGAYDALPKIAKILVQIILGSVVGGVYRILRYLEKKNVTTLIVGILALIPPISFIFWVLDLYTMITAERISVLAD